MYKGLLAVAAGAALIASPAFAGDKEKKPPVDPSQKIECRDMEGVGSHIPDRICKTRAEWLQEANDAHSLIDHLGSKATPSTGGLAPGQTSPGGPH